MKIVDANIPYRQLKCSRIGKYLDYLYFTHLVLSVAKSDLRC